MKYKPHVFLLLSSTPYICKPTRYAIKESGGMWGINAPTIEREIAFIREKKRVILFPK